MAGEIRVTAGVVVRNPTSSTSTLSFDWNPGTVSIDQSAARMSGGSQLIGGTTPEAIVFTDIATPGMTLFRNQDTSSTIEIGTGTGTSFVALLSLKPGEIALGRCATTAPTARVTSTNNCLLWSQMLSN